MDGRAILAATFALGVFWAAPALPEAPPPTAPALAEEAAPAASAPAEEPVPAGRQPAADNAIIGDIRIERGNIFDTRDPEEDNWLFRLANRLHIRTRAWVISRQLLFRPGDPYDPRLLAESERILRSNGYFYDARVDPAEVRDGRVDVEVRTRDVWTLQPGISYERKGGKNTTGISLKDSNLLGLGFTLNIASRSTPDRQTRSVSYSDGHFLGTRLTTDLLLSDNSDGRQRRFSLMRPFYALDARWSAGGLIGDEERIDTLVGPTNVAGRIRVMKKNANLSGGWSPGLAGGWAWRVLLGGTWDESRFSVPPGEPPAPVPADRVLAYPYAGFELLQDDYEKAKNRNQIERTEDFYLGLRLRATVGYAFPAIGADRYAVPFTAFFGDGGDVGDRWTVTGSASADGRIEGGAARDTTLSAATQIYMRMSERWLTFASLAGSRLVSPDGDHQLQLGGDTGLRGYPTRYQAGDRQFLVTLEQRYFSTLYIFRLFRLGAAVFFDVGRAWGGDVAGLPDPGVLRDAGVGLRVGVTRSGLGNVIHVDVAFPFDGDPSIDPVQLLVTTKYSF